MKFQKDEPKNNAFPARVFGTEISNLGKPVKPITRSKNTLTTQNNLNVKPMEISTSNNEVNLTNCYFHPQQVQMKSMQIEEEDVEIEDSSKKLEDPQYISGYVKEIFAYLRDMEVLT